jgi:transposase
MHGWVVEDAIMLVTVLDSRISKLEAEIRKQAKPDKRVEAVMAIPGIGCCRP